MTEWLGFSAVHALLALVTLSVCGCARNDQPSSLDGPERHRAVLETRSPMSQGPIISMFSLTLARTVSDPKQAELCYYFDRDDCAGGAIIGHRDETGWLVPIGNCDWQDLQQDEIPSTDGDATEGIQPVTKAHEGFAFWVRTVNDRKAIVRIAKVRPATYKEVASGKTASVAFEWMWR